MDKKILLSGLVASVLLVGCRVEGTRGSADSALMLNPFYAERYAHDLVETMVDLSISKDPLLEDAAKSSLVERARENWITIATNARQTQKNGMRGSFVAIKEYAQGMALYLDDTLYFSTEFETEPGPSLHVYLTQEVDPRSVTEFPDLTAFDLGRLKTPYGVQQYDVPKVERSELYRTVVLWDKELERLYGFAQLTK